MKIKDKTLSEQELKILNEKFKTHQYDNESWTTVKDDFDEVFSIARSGAIMRKVDYDRTAEQEQRANIRDYSKTLGVQIAGNCGGVFVVIRTENKLVNPIIIS